MYHDKQSCKLHLCTFSQKFWLPSIQMCCTLFRLLPSQTCLMGLQAFRLEAFSLANHHNPAAIRPLKLYAIRVHVACGVALALSLACGRLF